MATNENNLDAYNEVATTLGGAGGDLNGIDAVNAIAILEGTTGGHLNMINALNAIDLDAGGPGGHLNTLDALNSIVVLKGGLGGHENDLDAINEWVDNASPVPPPLDLVAGAALAYGTRLLRTAYAGNALRVRRSSDNAEQDIGFSGGELDTVAIEAFCGAGDGFVTTWYDQSGNADDLLQSTAAAQPQIVSSGSTLLRNGKPTVRYDGVDDYLAVSVVGLNIPVTIVAALAHITWALSLSIWDGQSGGGNDMALLQGPTTTPQLRMVSFGGEIVLSPSLPLVTLGVLTSVYDTGATASTFRLNDNSELTGNTGPINPVGFVLGRRGTTAGHTNIDTSECLLYASVLSAADQLLLRDNINAFYTVF